MKILAPAKLNLFLEVTGKRPNGYHELYSLCAFLDLADELEIVEDSGVRCQVSSVSKTLG
jgi:4-diphosphocytidyl-2-C-methyl-D-erythritol kinase